ncbi:spore germination protein [Peribacillus kribbensis]|uniref:spore germination protein n=1 Tax=Peribacillus kribbensis TaxID=356658 RepID=UPI000403F87D|nr:spore germination protein [Peribacillus kribbensis]
MPSFGYGPVQITHNSAGGIIQFGDSVVISPKEANKTTNGSGSGNTALMVVNNNLLNGNSVIDPNIVDQPMIGNN